MLNNLRAVRYSAPTCLWVGATLPMSDRRPPAGLVGIPQSSGCWRPPHSQPLKPWSLSIPLWVPGDHLVLWWYCVSGAVLVSPTDNRVLNQIPAGDGRESSREQVVPDDGALFLNELSVGGWETISPLDFSWTQWQSDFPDPQKKKKKKWQEAEVGPDHYFHIVPTGQPLSRSWGLPPR